MARNVSISEGGVARAFGNTKRLVTTDGKGRDTWVPSSDYPRAPKHVTSNGTYKAGDDGLYAYSSVDASVIDPFGAIGGVGSSVVGIDPVTMEPTVYSIDPNGMISSKPAMERVRVEPEREYVLRTSGICFVSGHHTHTGVFLDDGTGMYNETSWHGYIDPTHDPYNGKHSCAFFVTYEMLLQSDFAIEVDWRSVPQYDDDPHHANPWDGWGSHEDDSLWFSISEGNVAYMQHTGKSPTHLDFYEGKFYTGGGAQEPFLFNPSGQTLEGVAFKNNRTYHLVSSYDAHLSNKRGDRLSVNVYVTCAPLMTCGRRNISSYSRDWDPITGYDGRVFERVDLLGTADEKYDNELLSYINGQHYLDFGEYGAPVDPPIAIGNTTLSNMDYYGNAVISKLGVETNVFTSGWSINMSKAVDSGEPCLIMLFRYAPFARFVLEASHTLNRKYDSLWDGRNWKKVKIPPISRKTTSVRTVLDRPGHSWNAKYCGKASDAPSDVFLL